MFSSQVTDVHFFRNSVEEVFVFKEGAKVSTSALEKSYLDENKENVKT